MCWLWARGHRAICQASSLGSGCHQAGSQNRVLRKSSGSEHHRGHVFQPRGHLSPTGTMTVPPSEVHSRSQASCCVQAGGRKALLSSHSLPLPLTDACSPTCFRSDPRNGSLRRDVCRGPLGPEVPVTPCGPPALESASACSTPSLRPQGPSSRIGTSPGHFLEPMSAATTFLSALSRSLSPTGPT